MLPIQAQAQQLGRLFFTVSERASLDHLRKTGVKLADEKNEKQSPVPTIQLEEQTERRLTVNGFVRRANGKSTTWLNHVELLENQAGQEIRVKQTAARPSVISVYFKDGKKMELKVGQSVDRANGRVHDVLNPPPDTANQKNDRTQEQ